MMFKFKKFLIPIAAVGLLLTTLVGCGQPLGEVFDPSGNPFGHRFSDMKDIRTATFVVAASDSEHKYDVDFRCDGIDDQVQIQAAIDALPASGGSVLLLEGNYLTSDTVKLDKNYSTLRGQGSCSVIRCSANVDVVQIGGDDAGHASIENLLIDLMIEQEVGTAAGNGTYVAFAGNAKIVRVDTYHHGVAESCIKVSDFAWDTQITECTIEEGRAYGIDLRGKGRGAITHCYFSQNVLASIHLVQDGAAGNIYVISNNTMSDDRCIHYEEHGQFTILVGNKMTGGADCIYIDSTSFRGVIADNLIEGVIGINFINAFYAMSGNVQGNTFSCTTPISTGTNKLVGTSFPWVQDVFISCHAETVDYCEAWQAANNTNWHAITTDPDYPRLVSITLRNNTGAPDDGNATDVQLKATTPIGGEEYVNATLTVSFSAADLAAVPDGGTVTKWYSLALAKFSAPGFRLIVAQPANWNVAIGIGDTFGLCNTPIFETEKVVRNGVDVDPVPALISPRLIDLSPVGAGDDIIVYYQIHYNHVR